MEQDSRNPVMPVKTISLHIVDENFCELKPLKDYYMKHQKFGSSRPFFCVCVCVCGCVLIKSSWFTDQLTNPEDWLTLPPTESCH